MSSDPKNTANVRYSSRWMNVACVPWLRQVGWWPCYPIKPRGAGAEMDRALSWVGVVLQRRHLSGRHVLWRPHFDAPFIGPSTPMNPLYGCLLDLPHLSAELCWRRLRDDGNAFLPFLLSPTHAPLPLPFPIVHSRSLCRLAPPPSHSLLFPSAFLSFFFPLDFNSFVSYFLWLFPSRACHFKNGSALLRSAQPPAGFRLDSDVSAFTGRLVHTKEA